MSAQPSFLLDARGYRRSVSTLPRHRTGRPPRNRGRRYPPDPPSVEEVVALLQACPNTPTGRRLHALIIVLWRSGLRISAALDLHERDLDPDRGAITVRRGKGGKRRIAGMDPWGWTELMPWLEIRKQLPPGPVFCVVHGPTAGRAVTASATRTDLRRLQRAAGVRRRVAPHQFRHGYAVELVREGAPVHILQRQLGHSNLAVTTLYLSAVAPEEVLDVAMHRHAPTVNVGHLLRVGRRP